jgi:GAF domain-containing protein
MEGIVCSGNKRQLDDFDQSPSADALDARRIVHHLRELLAVDEVSYWSLVSEGRALAARLTAVSDSDASGASAPLQLSTEQCAGYFAATQATGLLISQDALHDERIAATRKCYLEPRDIQAVLSIAISVDAQPVAIVSCAQRGRHHHWSFSDVAVMQQLAADLAADYGRRRKRQGSTGRCRLLVLQRVCRFESLNG